MVPGRCCLFYSRFAFNGCERRRRPSSRYTCHVSVWPVDSHPWLHCHPTHSFLACHCSCSGNEAGTSNFKVGSECVCIGGGARLCCNRRVRGGNELALWITSSNASVSVSRDTSFPLTGFWQPSCDKEDVGIAIERESRWHDLSSLWLGVISGSPRADFPGLKADIGDWTCFDRRRRVRCTPTTKNSMAIGLEFNL